ncbi:MAG: hypothetical protein ACRDTG_16100 [Pseudonocardiaceae bacterium]
MVLVAPAEGGDALRLLLDRGLAEGVLDGDGEGVGIGPGGVGVALASELARAGTQWCSCG